MDIILKHTYIYLYFLVSLETDELYDFTRLGGGPLEVYKDQQLCWHFGIHEGDKGQCTSPDVFGKFLGLLDSISYSDSATNSSESPGDLPDFRCAILLHKLVKCICRDAFGGS